MDWGLRGFPAFCTCILALPALAGLLLAAPAGGEITEFRSDKTFYDPAENIFITLAHESGQDLLISLIDPNDYEMFIGICRERCVYEYIPVIYSEGGYKIRLANKTDVLEDVPVVYGEITTDVYRLPRPQEISVEDLLSVFKMQKQKLMLSKANGGTIVQLDIPYLVTAKVFFLNELADEAEIIPLYGTTHSFGTSYSNNVAADIYPGRDEKIAVVYDFRMHFFEVETVHPKRNDDEIAEIFERNVRGQEMPVRGRVFFEGEWVALGEKGKAQAFDISEFKESGKGFFEALFDAGNVLLGARQARAFGKDGKEAEGIIAEVVNNEVIVDATNAPPGIYKLVISGAGLLNNLETTFANGLLIVNTDKDVYRTGETGRLFVVLLNETGHPVMDAMLSLNMSCPEQQFRTDFREHGAERVFVEDRTYVAEFYAGQACVSEVNAAAEYDGIRLEFETWLETKDEPGTRIIREAQSTLDPWEERFESRLWVEGGTPGINYTLVDMVPASPDVECSCTIIEKNGKKYLVWEDLKEGQAAEYRAKVPEASPELYRIGPAAVFHRDVFVEQTKEWLLAADPYLPELNYTGKSCYDEWGFDCSTGPPETGGSNTFDGCSSGAGGDESIDDIIINASVVRPGAPMNVTCVIDPYVSDDYFYIWYYNSTGWRMLYSEGPFGSTSIETRSVTFTADNISGTHWLRCGIAYNCESTGPCVDCNPSYHDNDDISFIVAEHYEFGISSFEIEPVNKTVNEGVHFSLNATNSEDIILARINISMPNGTKISDDLIFNGTKAHAEYFNSTGYSFNGSQTEELIFSDNFNDNTLNKWSQLYANGDWAAINQEARATDCNPSRIQTFSTNLSGYESGRLLLSYRREGNVDAGSCLEYWLYNGTWDTSTIFCGNVDTTYQQAEYNISESHLVSGFLLGINCIGFNRPNRFGYIDDVFLYATKSDKDSTKSMNYDSIDDTSFINIDNITIRLTVDFYDPSGSVEKGNKKPDLSIYLNTGAGFARAKKINLSADYTGDSRDDTDRTYEVTVTNSTILKSWLNPANRDIRISIAYVDYYNQTKNDAVGIKDLDVAISGTIREGASWLYYYELPAEQAEHPGEYSAKAYFKDEHGNNISQAESFWTKKTALIPNKNYTILYEQTNITGTFWKAGSEVNISVFRGAERISNITKVVDGNGNFSFSLEFNSSSDAGSYRVSAKDLARQHLNSTIYLFLKKPELSTEHDQYVREDTIYIYGEGFNPGEEVSLRITNETGSDLFSTTLTANSTTGVSHSFFIDTDTGLGDYLLNLTETGEPRRKANKTIEIVEVIVLPEKSQYEQGEIAWFFGSKWPEASIVNVTIKDSFGSTALAELFEANSTGDFKGNYTLSYSAPIGQYEIKGFDASDPELNSSSFFNVNKREASIKLKHNWTKAGQSLDINGTKFSPGSVVLFEVYSQGLLADEFNFTSGANGSFYEEWSIPLGYSAGTYSLVAVDSIYQNLNASKDFQIKEIAFQTNKNSYEAGDDVIIEGFWWNPESNVEINITNSTGVVASELVYADELGYFMHIWQAIGGVENKKYNITATQPGEPRFNATKEIVVLRGITITAEREKYSAKEVVNILGQYYSAGSNASLWIKDWDGYNVEHYPKRLLVNSTGQVSDEWNTSLYCKGNYTLKARDEASEMEREASLELTYYDFSTKTCSDEWGFSCATGPPETGGSNTFDGCSSGAQGGNRRVNIDDMWLNASKVQGNSMMQVTCQIIPESRRTYFYIWYYNSTGWRRLYLRENFAQAGPVNYTVSFTADNVVGQHWVRCGIVYDSPQAGSCIGEGTENHDNDDISFIVVEPHSQCTQTDRTRPSVSDIYATGTLFVNQTIQIHANVSDNRAVSVVYANITLPRSKEQLDIEMADNSLDGVYNASFLVPAGEYGNLSVRIYARDTSYNINNSESISLDVKTKVYGNESDVDSNFNTLLNVDGSRINIAANYTGMLNVSIYNLTELIAYFMHNFSEPINLSAITILKQGNAISASTNDREITFNLPLVGETCNVKVCPGVLSMAECDESHYVFREPYFGYCPVRVNATSGEDQEELDDVAIFEEDIWFSKENPREGESVRINVTVHNRGTTKLTNLLVRVVETRSDEIIMESIIPEILPGKNVTISENYEAMMGLNLIKAMADPEGAIDDVNRSNNNATRGFQGGIWNLFFGNAYANIKLRSASEDTVVEWPSARLNGTALFAPGGTNIDFASLVAIGRDTDEQPSTGDFHELDMLLGFNGTEDNITTRFAVDAHTPKRTRAFRLGSSIIENVPYANSTDNANFLTGIVWDKTKDTNGEFDISDREDIAFITEINVNATGKHGTYDYEIAVPASLRDYNTLDNRIDVYLVLS